MNEPCTIVSVQMNALIFLFIYFRLVHREHYTDLLYFLHVKQALVLVRTRDKLKSTP